MTFALGPRAISAGYRLVPFDAIGSTNAAALSRAQAGERGPIWFTTTDQTAGRGRRNRAWIAPRGNLASSVLEIMTITPLEAATLGFAAGLALLAALRSTAACNSSQSKDFRLKWPNDLLADGRKICGILIEAETLSSGELAVVVGMGTNVVTSPEGTPFPATSLKALGMTISAEELFAELSDSWAEHFAIWDGGQGFARIRELWLQNAAGIGQIISVHSGAEIIEGVFETIDQQGGLVLRGMDGQRTSVSAGDVHFGSAASVGVA